MKLIKYEPDMAAEQEWLEKEPNRSLAGASVMIPEGTELSETAVDTIRHVRFYTDAGSGFVLLSDRVFAVTEGGDPEDMIRQAHGQATVVNYSMSDFTPFDMDDDCGLLQMDVAKVYAFRPFELGSLPEMLLARAECLEACEKAEIVAVVLPAEKQNFA